MAWTSINATACTASGDWSGAKAVTGSQTTGNLTVAKVYTYTLTCTGAGGTAADSVTVNIGAKPSSGGGSSRRSSAVILSQDNLFEIEKTVGDLQAISFSDLFYVGPEEVFTFKIVVKADKASTDEVILKDILPTGLIYYGDLKIDGKTVEGDIIAGLDLGDFSADESKVITFQVKADKADNFSFGENKLINTAEVLQADFSAMDTAQVIVLKTAVAGAATEISTGLTNNIFLDSFFLPLVLSCLILWLLKSHILRLEEWLDRRKKQYTSYRLEKTLQLKIAKIKTREFLGRIF